MQKMAAITRKPLAKEDEKGGITTKRSAFLMFWLMLLFLLNSLVLGGDQDLRYYFPATHSHNDCRRPRPLFDALENGMGIIEPDVFYLEIPIIDDKGRSRTIKELYVAHDWEEITGDFSYTSRGTLRQLYLDPLYEIFAKKGGKIFNSPEETLLLHVDFKTEIQKSWLLLQKMLSSYPDLFTVFCRDSNEVIPGPVTVFTNAEPKPIPEDWDIFYSTVDGRFGNIYDPLVWKSKEYLSKRHRMPVVSSNFRTYNDEEKIFDFSKPIEVLIEQYQECYPNLSRRNFFQELRAENWKLANILVTKGEAVVSRYLLQNMKEADRLGRENGHLMRFWAAPDYAWFWDVLSELPNVVISTGKPRELREYLLGE